MTTPSNVATFGVRAAKTIHRNSDLRYPWPLCRNSLTSHPGLWTTTTREATCKNCLRLP